MADIAIIDSAVLLSLPFQPFRTGVKERAPRGFGALSFIRRAQLQAVRVWQTGIRGASILTVVIRDVPRAFLTHAFGFRMETTDAIILAFLVSLKLRNRFSRQRCCRGLCLCTPPRRVRRSFLILDN